MAEKYYSKTMLFVLQSNSNLSALATLHVLLLMYLTNSSAQTLAEPPCTNTKAISWIRDSDNCNKYFICHFGSPLSMPPCPKSQVWSNTALNCVPIGSRWDDCSTRTDFRPSGKTRYSYVNNYYMPGELSKFTKINNNKIIRYRKRPKDRIKRIKNISKWHRYGNTRLPTVTPLFTPKAPTRFWTTGREVKDNIKRKYWYTHNTIRPTPSVTPKTTQRRRTNWDNNIPNGGRPWRYRTTQRPWTNRNNISLTTLDNSAAQFCIENPGAYFVHPTNCHWYYNCSLGNLDDESTIIDGVTSVDDDVGFMRLRPFRVQSAGAFVWECRYPQLFDDVTNVCREFVNVRCGSRFEPVDQCEYSQRRCTSGRCESCRERFGRCRGRTNGIYPIQARLWSPVFMTCYQSRNIAQDRCEPPKPIFSPDKFECVSLFEVPKSDGGFLPDCTSRRDGYYPDERGRCAIFFRCSLGKFRGFDECPPGTVFDPAIPACQPYSAASLPCGAGQAPLCGGKQDGRFADPYGRCTHYFRCSSGTFQGYQSCDVGIFDPLTQSCTVSAALTLRPCGLKPSPCESLPTGIYPDQATHCRNFIECHRGIIITNGTCDAGRVFSATTGRCDLPQNAPPPCGLARACVGRRDGRYPALDRGCSFYYECFRGEFTSLRRCTVSEGGIFFNPASGRCDYPQNICPPCGHRWWGCARQ